MALSENDTLPKLLLEHARLRGDRPAYREKDRHLANLVLVRNRKRNPKSQLRFETARV